MLSYFGLTLLSMSVALGAPAHTEQRALRTNDTRQSHGKAHPQQRESTVETPEPPHVFYDISVDARDEIERLDRYSLPTALALNTPLPLTPIVPAANCRRRPVVWVRGTVRDEAGEPIPGASVMELATAFGGIRMNQVARQTVANGDGRYELEEFAGLEAFSATVLATAPGHPPAWAWPGFPSVSFSDGYDGCPPENITPVTLDLVLPSTSGKLRVTVVRRGQPQSSISVRLYRENARLRDIWALPLSDSRAMQDAAYPVAITNKKGLAEFANLLPGSYVIVAEPADAPDLSTPDAGAMRADRSQIVGIPVRTGETTRHKMNLNEQLHETRFRALRPDHSPVTKSDTVELSNFISIDSSGLAKTYRGGPGLWQVEVPYRDSPKNSAPSYHLASGYLASSRNLNQDNVPTFTGRPMTPGSARIQVLDAAGKPIRVTVRLAGRDGNHDGLTDENGVAVFTGLTWLTACPEYRVILVGTEQTEVQMVGRKFLVRPAGSLPPVKEWDFAKGLPPPEEMRAEPAIIEQVFVAHPNTETTIVMRAVPLTYIYGVIHSPADARRGHWYIYIDPSQGYGARYNTRQDTGEFVAGPFPPGEVRLEFGTEQPHYHATVKVDPSRGEPIRFDIDVEKYARDAAQTNEIRNAPDSAVMGMGGVASHAGGSSLLSGKVYFADGNTPALGAQVRYFDAHQTTSSLLAIADALGDLQPRGLWQTVRAAHEGDDPGPASPMLVAMLPGSCGATVQPAPRRRGEPLNLILPPAIAISGRVTVGGVSPSNRPGVVRVLAAYQGKGFLSPYLSVATTADADGGFTLAGLTPGDYVVQAALDNIWLSPPVTLHITGPGPARINLAIPEPGAPVRLALRDTHGKPIVGREITIERSGPLQWLWPDKWISDGAGVVYIPTLEAGPQTIHVTGVSKAVRFRVPPLPGAPIRVLVKIDDPGPQPSRD
jgi:hypothetical protein